MVPVTPLVQQLTRRLIAREEGSMDAPATPVAAVHAACEHVYRDLSRWVGQNGSRALFIRALAEVRAQSPILADIDIRVRSAAGLDGVSESIQTHGAPAVAGALESLLQTLLALLARLIGDDMVVRLVEADERDRPRVEGRAGTGGSSA
jgi:hypothetical protein